MRAAILGLGLIAACGSAPPDTSDGKSIFPIAVGNEWEYRVQDTNSTQTKVQTVTSTDTNGFVFQTARGDRRTYSVQKIDGEGRLIRTSEYSTDVTGVVEKVQFVPYDIRVDTDDLDLGTRYEQTFTEDHDPSDGLLDVTKTQTFIVEAVDEQITVPAGTYRAIRIRRTTNNGADKTFWYAKGVGKLKEAGGQLEELVRVEVAE